MPKLDRSHPSQGVTSIGVSQVKGRVAQPDYGLARACCQRSGPPLRGAGGTVGRLHRSYVHRQAPRRTGLGHRCGDARLRGGRRTRIASPHRLGRVAPRARRIQPSSGAQLDTCGPCRRPDCTNGRHGYGRGGMYGMLHLTCALNAAALRQPDESADHEAEAADVAAGVGAGTDFGHQGFGLANYGFCRFTLRWSVAREPRSAS